MYTVEIFNQYNHSIFGKPTLPMTLAELQDYIRIMLVNDLTDCRYEIKEVK